MHDKPGIKHIFNPELPIPVKGIAGRVAYYAGNGILLYWSSFFLLIFIEFFIGGQLSKVLTKENYSIYINVLNTLPFYNILVNAGLAYGITYIVSYNARLGYPIFRESMRIQIIWYLLLVIVHAAICFFYRDLFTISLLITILIAFAYSYKLNVTSLFLARRSYNKAALSNTLQKVTLLFIFLAICYVQSLQNLLNRQLALLYPAIELSIVVLYMIVFSRTNYLSFSSHKFTYRRRLLKYGKYAMVNNGLNVLYYSLLALIIRSSALALHMQIIMGLCIMFFRYTAVAIAPVFSTMNPQFTSIKNDKESVQKMYRKYLIFVVFMGLTTMIGCRLFFGFIIDHFYAASYADLPSYFYLFCYLIPLLFLNSLNGSVMAALGKIKLTTYTEVICSFLLVLFLVYNMAVPVADYMVLYYAIIAHLAVKAVLLGYGVFTSIKND